MSKSPLRTFIEDTGVTAEAWAIEHGFSAWSVRHWSRGDKVPDLANQQAIERATAGCVTPAHWLSWSLERRRKAEQGRAA